VCRLENGVTGHLKLDDISDNTTDKLVEDPTEKVSVSACVILVTILYFYLCVAWTNDLLSCKADQLSFVQL
jgi:hypothetical protein